MRLLLGAAATGGVWTSVVEVLLLLAAALLLGTLAERFRQSAIVGYLLAGSLVGPSALGWVSQQEDVFQIAELGVALLLFAIGLEFSPRDLLRLGRVPLLAGPLQVVLTLLAGLLSGLALGLSGAESLVVGAMVALSSTACVVRLLADRAEIDSDYGRTSLGILLVQDVAVVPLMLIVTALTTGGGMVNMVGRLAASIGLTVLLVVAFSLLFTHLVPRLWLLASADRNRDLPILVAVVTAIGSAWAAHALGLSPALGSFVGGVILASSPFAIQIRADVEPLKTILVTLFFAAVGMLGDVRWLFQNWGLVIAVVAAVVAGKTLMTGLLTWFCGQRLTFAVAASLCLAQVGEFSFVLATIARGDETSPGILSDATYRALVSATILTLLLTPYLVIVAPRAGGMCERFWRRCASRIGLASAGLPGPRPRQPSSDDASDLANLRRILIIGFGPAGQRVAEDLLTTHPDQLVAIDLNLQNLEIAKRYGLDTHLGDATQIENLEHAGIRLVSTVVITVPSPQVSRRLIHLVRHLAPGAMIVARSRYHLHRWQLLHAGADVVVDEEDRVGHEIADEIRRIREEPNEEQAEEL